MLGRPADVKGTATFENQYYWLTGRNHRFEHLLLDTWKVERSPRSRLAIHAGQFAHDSDDHVCVDRSSLYFCDPVSGFLKGRRRGRFPACHHVQHAGIDLRRPWPIDKRDLRVWAKLVLDSGEHCNGMAFPTGSEQAFHCPSALNVAC
jgi:hypothetical protein